MTCDSKLKSFSCFFHQMYVTVCLVEKELTDFSTNYPYFFSKNNKNILTLRSMTLKTKIRYDIFALKEHFRNFLRKFEYICHKA